VDFETRAVAACALQRFLDCDTTNDDYESEYPLPELFGRKWSSDLAIRAIYEFSWSLFDDINTHRLEGKYALNEETERVGRRCVLFLRSSAEYEWREAKFIKAGALLSHLVTLNLMDRPLTLEEQLAAHLNEAEGEAAVWPFFRHSTYELALNEQRTKGS
jgi:hypothetical protein